MYKRRSQPAAAKVGGKPGSGCVTPSSPCGQLPCLTR
jgi:hypothetical protein